jgi:hypothetical protein
VIKVALECFMALAEVFRGDVKTSIVGRNCRREVLRVNRLPLPGSKVEGFHPVDLSHVLSEANGKIWIFENENLYPCCYELELVSLIEHVVVLRPGRTIGE